MATRTREDRRLRLLSAVCLGLPEVERIDCGAHADFRVRGKVFAYFLKNHGGDGIIAACFKSRLGEHIEHVKRAPDRFYLPRFIGKRGWCGLRLDQGDIDWDEVKALDVGQLQPGGTKRTARRTWTPVAHHSPPNLWCAARRPRSAASAGRPARTRRRQSAQRGAWG